MNDLDINDDWSVTVQGKQLSARLAPRRHLSTFNEGAGAGVQVEFQSRMSRVHYGSHVEETVTFRFDSLSNVTFTATRTVRRGPRRSADIDETPVGWIRLHASDDETSEILMDGGSIGPETAELQDTYPSADGIFAYFRWEVRFRFSSLPGVTFYATRSTEDVVDDEGGRRASGWVDLYGLRDIDLAVVYGGGTSGPDRTDRSTNAPPLGQTNAASLALSRQAEITDRPSAWGLPSDIDGESLLVVPGREHNAGPTSPARVFDAGSAAWGCWQPISTAPLLALAKGSGRFRFVSRDGTEFERAVAVPAETTWGSWAFVGGSWRLVIGATNACYLWDIQDSSQPVRYNAASVDLNWGIAVHVWYVDRGTSQVELVTVLVGGGPAGLRIFDLESAREIELSGQAREDSLDPALWGCLTTVGGVNIIATGGASNEVKLWPIAPGGIRCLKLPVGDADFGPTTWGAWGQLGSEPVLAVGGNGARGVHMWYPSMRRESQKATDIDFRWGSWGSLGGKTVLFGGLDAETSAWELTTATSVSDRPDYRSDSVGTDGGVDALDRQVEASALAEVISSRTAKPPLAIGIFGQWGEGKSHFMDLLYREISSVASNQATEAGDEANHRFIRQVRFNAWHYSETDLWASLVSEIFGQLSHSDSDSADIAGIQRQQSRLLSEIVSERRLPERIAAEKARTQKLKEARQHANPALQSRTNRAELKSALKSIDPDLVSDFDQLVEAADGWQAFRRRQVLRVVASFPWAKILLVVTALALIVGIVWIQIPDLPARTASIVVTLGTLGAGYWNVLQPKLSDLSKYLSKTRSATQTLRTASRALADSLNRSIDVAVSVSESTVCALESELRDLTAAGQLAGLVTDRATNAKYRQSLGLMTEIRQDFERMSRLLTRDRSEYANNDVAGDGIPRIDRIVLYIDDLDRCPPRRVVEVLEAVHLMLALELFVVVLAVDPRWMHRAVGVHYAEMLGSENGDGTVGHSTTTPTQYLEKIFQIVLNIPPLDTSGYVSLLKHLVVRRTALTAGATSSDGSDMHDGEITTAAAGEVDVQPFDLAPPPKLPHPRQIERTDPLAFDRDELLLLQILGPPVITTPRALKRLVNSYALMTAIRRRRSQPSSGPVLRPGLVLLALSIGFPEVAPAILNRLLACIRLEQDSTWPEFLGDLAAVSDDALAAGSRRPSAAEFVHVADALTAVADRAQQAGVALPDALSQWTPWIPWAARLTFSSEGSTVGSAARIGDILT